MAYDEETAARFREQLEGMVGITEKRMMGGVCFMLNGNMLGGAHREKSGARLFMFRIGKEGEKLALSKPNTRPVQLGTRAPLRGFIFVDADACGDQELQAWISLALSHVAAKPSK